MIPKIIHYCWLSGDAVPDDYKRCMDSWNKNLPGYEFVLWDAERFDLNSVLWVKQAYEAKVYACAADYIRLYAVYNHGGIYLDMDMEVVKPFDPLLSNDLILAYENHINKNIEAGCFGAAKNHPYIKKCMEYFEKTPLFNPSLSEKIMSLPKSERHSFINPLILPEVMKNAGDDFFKKEAFNFYPCSYFTAKNILTGKIEKTDDAYTVHHFSSLYHSQEWLENRNAEQRVYAKFGENAFSKTLVRLRTAARRVKRRGFLKTVKYYFGVAAQGKAKNGDF
ncbi:MAG: glycosyl transferase [Spirochaetaceae bacterium]|jgi:hypothetical protein|nr:glycosyl transferase [Spirochaetaceae bacterium]